MEKNKNVITRVKEFRLQLAERNQIIIENELDFIIVSTALKNLELDLILQKEKLL